MKAYYETITETLNGKHIHQTIHLILTEDYPQIKTISLNWDNIREFTRKMGLNTGSVLWNCKKGLKLWFSESEGREWTHCVKQWKTELDLKVTYTYEEVHPSIDTILNYREGDKAIQYLIERGFKYCP